MSEKKEFCWPVLRKDLKKVCITAGAVGIILFISYIIGGFCIIILGVIITLIIMIGGAIIIDVIISIHDRYCIIKKECDEK